MSHTIIIPYHHTYIRAEGSLADFNLEVVKSDRQTAKFNSSPNFPVIRYPICNAYTRWVLFQVKVRPQQELEEKLGDGWTFVGGPSFMRLQY